MIELPVGQIVQGDCLEVMRGWPAGCVDAVITDPPYGLSFMGKKWDYDVPSVAIWQEVMRVLKDGGRLLAFSGPRTYHRMAVNIEDAGFTIEDQIMWLYGSGFPKHGSKLKPAHEPIVVARKGSVSSLNIDACRIEGSKGNGNWRGQSEKPKFGGPVFASGTTKTIPSEQNVLGRWPANVCLDAEAAAMLDEQSGVSGGADRRVNASDEFHGGVHEGYRRPNASAYTHKIEGQVRVVGDTGGASRFFYCAKASASERNAGCGRLELKHGVGTMSGDADGSLLTGSGNPRNTTAANHHPTVKPVDLMQWLLALVSEQGQTILDPFAGSGTTCVAAERLGRRWIGIELSPEYCQIARARTAQKGLFT